jgi:hypothetical protein
VLMIVSVVAGAGGVLAWWHIGAMYFSRSLVAYDTYVSPQLNSPGRQQPDR